jgi:hypothetical protein
MNDTLSVLPGKRFRKLKARIAEFLRTAAARCQLVAKRPAGH